MVEKDDHCDLGIQSIGIPVSKILMYTVCGGIRPSDCLPIVIDAGTDNEKLLANPFYVGCRHKRVTDDSYFELLDEILTCIFKY